MSPIYIVTEQAGLILNLEKCKETCGFDNILINAPGVYVSQKIFWVKP
jgi:hypothetical protein